MKITIFINFIKKNMYLLSNFKSYILLALVFIITSCSQLRYSDYGKPLDFLKSHHVNNKNSVLHHEVVANEKEKTKLLSNENYTLPSNTINEILLPKHTMNNFLLKNDSKVLRQSKVDKKASNVLIQERLINPSFNSYSIKAQYNSGEKQTSYNEEEDIVLMILCVLLPPLAVFFSYDISNEFWIDLLLTLLFFLPGIIYALYVCFYK
jgi:uncharacterized membrane protein YqaE (UPF0057 family)